jgi:hypothetical protein
LGVLLYRKTAIAVGMALLAPGITAGSTNAAPHTDDVPAVKIGAKPRVDDPGHGAVKLLEESAGMGEKIYTGTLKSGEPIRVIQYESPIDAFESPRLFEPACATDNINVSVAG